MQRVDSFNQFYFGSIVSADAICMGINMTNISVKPIGTVISNSRGFFVKLDEAFIPGIKELGGFSHLDILWWSHELDSEEMRGVLQAPKPYKKAPEVMGIFATRSPLRPNPICLSISGIIDVDEEKGLIQLDYLDAHDGTPVLDLKPYTPSADRIEEPGVPDWCSHWPKSVETSEDFNWADEFMF